MEREPLRQGFASRDAPILDSMGEIEVDVQASFGRSNAAEDPARSVEDDYLRRDLYADVVELLDHG
jgi:hypothetical protein